MARLDHKAVIMSLGWTLLLVLPTLAFKIESFGWNADHKGRISMENSFSSASYSSSSSSSSSSNSGDRGSMWPSSSVSVSSQEEALDDKFSFKVITAVITLPGSVAEDIELIPMRANGNHRHAFIKVRAQSQDGKKFEQDFEMTDLPVNERLPGIRKSFDDGRMTFTVRYKIPRVGKGGFSGSSFGNAGFDNSHQPENDPFNTPFFNSGFD